MKDHVSELRIESRNERDLRSCEVTEAVTNKAQKKFWGSNGIRTHDLRDTGAMIYRLSYEASPEAGQVRVQFIPIIWRERCEVYMIKIIWVNCGYRIENFRIFSGFYLLLHNCEDLFLF